MVVVVVGSGVDLGSNNAKGPQFCQQVIELRNYVNGSSGISHSSGLHHRRGVVKANLLRGGRADLGAGGSANGDVASVS